MLRSLTSEDEGDAHVSRCLCHGTIHTQNAHKTSRCLCHGTMHTQNAHRTPQCLCHGTIQTQNAHRTPQCLCHGTMHTQNAHKTSRCLCHGTMHTQNAHRTPQCVTVQYRHRTPTEHHNVFCHGTMHTQNAHRTPQCLCHGTMHTQNDHAGLVPHAGGAPIAVQGMNNTARTTRMGCCCMLPDRTCFRCGCVRAALSTQWALVPPNPNELTPP